MENNTQLERISNADLKPVTEHELVLHLENLGLLKDLTAGEKNTYLQIAKAFNLNPFKREIHVSKYNGQMSIITGYEVYIKRAERSGVLDGWEVECTGEVKDNSLKAKITIWRKDRTKPFTWETKYSEYVQKTKEGNVNKFWLKAETMIKKVVMAQGFRLCFNDELGGMPYTSEEFHTEDIPHEEVKAVPVKKLTALNDTGFKKLMDKLVTGADVDAIVANTMDKCSLNDKQAQLFTARVAELQTTAAV